jgi:hypothetical protein
VQTLAALLALALPVGRALAQAPAEAPAPKLESTAAVSAAAGMFLPTVIAPRVDSQRGYVRMLGGYDSARRSAQFEALADVTIIGPLAARVGALYTENPIADRPDKRRPDQFRPSFGLRLQALSQEHQGIDLGVGAYYKPEGFTEAEGEIEVVLSFARRFGRLATFANLVYGQDPDAQERDGEVRIGALYAVSSLLQLGADARLRLDLGSDAGARRVPGKAEYDLVWGPPASYARGPNAAMAQAGLSVFGTQHARLGAVALLGVAGVL